MTGPVEWLVGLVLGVDALVIAGILVSRLSGRARRRNGSTAVADRAPTDRLETYTASTADTSAVAEAPVGETVPIADVDPATAAETIAVADIGPATLAEPLAPDLEPQPPDDEPPMPTAPPPETTDGLMSLEDTAEDGAVSGEALEARPKEALPPSPTPTDWDAAVAETPAIPEPAYRPVGLDFGPTWIDPVAMAGEAAAEWRRGLRRDLALAAWRGRPAMVMNLKLDVESEPDLSIPDVARYEGQLHQTIGRLVRSSDHFDRTGPGRFHVILSEMAESASIAVAERIRHGFAESVGADAPRLLIGWAAMETEADVALALQRAAERLDGLAAPESAPPPSEPIPPVSDSTSPIAEV